MTDEKPSIPLCIQIPAEILQRGNLEEISAHVLKVTLEELEANGVQLNGGYTASFAERDVTAQPGSGNESDGGFSLCANSNGPSSRVSSRSPSIASDMSMLDYYQDMEDELEDSEISNDVRSAVTPTPSRSGFDDLQDATTTLKQLLTATKTLQEQQLGLESLMNTLAIQQNETFHSLKEGTEKNVEAIERLLNQFAELQVLETRKPDENMQGTSLSVQPGISAPTGVTRPSTSAEIEPEYKKQKMTMTPIARIEQNKLETAAKFNMNPLQLVELERKEAARENIDKHTTESIVAVFLRGCKSYKAVFWQNDTLGKLIQFHLHLKESRFENAKALKFLQASEHVIEQIVRRIIAKVIWYNYSDSVSADCTALAVHLHDSFSFLDEKKQQFKKCFVDIITELFDDRCQNYGLCTPMNIRIPPNRTLDMKNYEHMMKIMRFAADLYNVDMLPLSLIKWFILRLQITTPNIEQFATPPCNDCAIELALVVVGVIQDKLCDEDTEYLFWLTQAISNISEYFAERAAKQHEEFLLDYNTESNMANLGENSGKEAEQEQKESVKKMNIHDEPRSFSIKDELENKGGSLNIDPRNASILNNLIGPSSSNSGQQPQNSTTDPQIASLFKLAK